VKSDQKSLPDWVVSWLSPARAAPYVRAAGAEGALALYNWNCQVSMALFELIGWFEVGWCNIVDQAISNRWQSQRHWLTDPTFPLHPTTREKVNQAREQIRKGGVANPTPGHMIAELPLGFWRFTSKGYRITVWRPYLSFAFPYAPRRPNPSDIDRTLPAIIQTRNRIAHHEPVFGRAHALRQLVTDIWLLGSFVNPEAARWWKKNNSALRMLNTQPSHLAHPRADSGRT